VTSLAKIHLRAAALLLALTTATAAQAAEFRIAIMQAQSGDARKYQPLLDYLGKKGFPAKFVTVPNYQSATDLFAAGSVDAMFGGSGVSCAMMLKGAVEPFARSLGAKGVKSYSAVVVAPRGSPKFDGTAAWFAGRRVICSPLAAGGEFYFRSFGPSKAAAVLLAASHGAALDALARGRADVAIVKNHVWAREQSKYPQLVQVGGDHRQHPDGGLVISARVDKAAARRLLALLLGLASDGSAEAQAARAALDITGFAAATAKDYEPTMAMIKEAGVTKAFDFQF
jgi:ABC-type phosphate/phosphonate transport system substrate-binding protein